MRNEIARLFLRLAHAIRPAKQTANSNETGAIATTQLQHNGFEVRQINSMQLYGFASATLSGCDLMTINIAGDNSNGVAIASNDQRYRPTGMAGGEVKLYDCNGQSVYLNTDGSIRVVATHQVTVTCDTSVTVTAPEVIIDGNLKVSGDIIDRYNTNPQTVADMRVIYDEHTHGDVQNGSGTTSTPSPQM